MNDIQNCVIVDDEPIAREILETFVEKTGSLNLLGSFQSAFEVIEFSKNHKIDVYFLDINMPEVNGLSLARIINNSANVIFTTAYRDYAIDGFNLNVIDYLLKPIAFDRFLQAVQKIPNKNITHSLPSTVNSSFLFVRSERKMVKVALNEVLYIESVGDYLKIYLNTKTILTRETINNILQKLPEANFLRIHRSYIVSIAKIDSYTNEYIEIFNKALPISRSFKESVLQKLAEM